MPVPIGSLIATSIISRAPPRIILIRPRCPLPAPHQRIIKYVKNNLLQLLRIAQPGAAASSKFQHFPRPWLAKSYFRSLNRLPQHAVSTAPVPAAIRPAARAKLSQI